MRLASQSGMRLRRACRPHPTTRVHLSHRPGQAEVSPETRLQIWARQRKRIPLQNRKPVLHRYLLLGFHIKFQQAAGDVLPDNHLAQLGTAAGVHQSQVGRQAGLQDTQEIPVHPQSATSTYPRDGERTHAGVEYVQGCAKFQSGVLRRGRYGGVGVGNHG